MFSNVQGQVKRTSASVGLLAIKLFTGFVLGLTVTLIGQEMIHYGQLVFWLIIVLTMAVFIKLAKRLSFTETFVLIFVCVLVGLLLKLYIQVAPN